MPDSGRAALPRSREQSRDRSVCPTPPRLSRRSRRSSRARRSRCHRSTRGSVGRTSCPAALRPSSRRSTCDRLHGRNNERRSRMRSSRSVRARRRHDRPARWNPDRTREWGLDGPRRLSPRRSRAASRSLETIPCCARQPGRQRHRCHHRLDTGTGHSTRSAVAVRNGSRTACRPRPCVARPIRARRNAPAGCSSRNRRSRSASRAPRPFRRRAPRTPQLPEASPFDAWLPMLTSNTAPQARQRQTERCIASTWILSYFSSTELVKFLSSIRRDAMLRFAIERKQE